MSRPRGRPSTYTPEMQEHAESYLDNYKENGDVVPSASGLCSYIGVNRKTLYRWRDEFPAFAELMDDVQNLQERVTLNNGLNNKFNANIAKLLLAKHGYSDRQAVDHSSSDGSMASQPTRIELVPYKAEEEEDSD